MITAILVGREKFLQQSQLDLVRRFAPGHRELTTWIDAHPGEAQAFVQRGLSEEVKGEIKLIVASWQRLTFTSGLTLNARVRHPRLMDAATRQLHERIVGRLLAGILARMSEKPTSAQKRALLIKLVVAALVLLAVAALLLRGVDLRAAFNALVEWLRGVGPGAFFAANAVLPAFGVPASAFTLTAGPVFGPQIGLGMVLLYFGLSVAVNLALTYWLARYAFRPILNSIIARLGYKLPTVSKANQLNVALVVRITPGPPFVLQGYLLGLAELPFKIYMLVSWPVAMVYAVAVIVFGDALMQGKFKVAVVALIALGVVGVSVKLLRQRYAKKPLESQVAAEPAREVE